MLKNHCLAKSITDVCWSMFTTMLEYKCEWYGVNLLKIGRFEPSSKTCSNCGTVNKGLTLKDREWTCVKCNTKYDRDINAAVNIKNFALRNYVSGTDTKTRNELPTLLAVAKDRSADFRSPTQHTNMKLWISTIVNTLTKQ